VLADMSISAVAQILTQGVTLDTMDSYGSLETLPFSLDSPAWQGGAGLLGLFGDDNKLSVLSGPAMEATFVTNDGEAEERTLLEGTRPHVDTRSVTIAIASREAEGDPVVFPTPEVMEDTGVVPAWASGFLSRARITILAGATWKKITGISVSTRKRGHR
jgi:hypothetical protein